MLQHHPPPGAPPHPWNRLAPPAPAAPFLLQVLQCTRQLRAWGGGGGSGGGGSGAEATYYDTIAKDPDVVKVVLLLTGSLEGMKLATTDYLSERLHFNGCFLLRCSVASSQTRAAPACFCFRPACE